jgi:hypothetical protein
VASSRPVKPSRLSHHLTEAREAKRGVRLDRDNKLITLAEVQALADLGGKNDPTAASEMNPERLGVGHPSNMPHIRS